MGETAPQIEEESFKKLIDHLGKLLAEEYITLMKKTQQEEGQNERSNSLIIQQ
jgi:hypothetical protein